MELLSRVLFFWLAVLRKEERCVSSKNERQRTEGGSQF